MAKRDLQRRIDLRPTTGGSRNVLSNVSSHGGSTAFDDEALVRRDGSHSLFSTARWLWELGAEVAGTLRSWGTGLVEIIGALYAGKAEGPAAGIYLMTDDAGNESPVMQAKDAHNVPIFAAGAPVTDDPDAAYVNIGRKGFPRIWFGALSPYSRKVPLVDVELLNGLILPAQINRSALAATLQVPVVTSLDGLSYSEGQLFLLRLGADSGALYVWTQWGPEPVGGYHRAGPHNHASFDEGEQLLLATGFFDVQVTAPAQADALVYDGTGEYWYNGDVSAARVALADAGEYFASDTVEAGMRYLVDWLFSVEGRI